MFNKLKQKVAEESKTDITSLNSNKTNNKTTNNISAIKSNQSDGSQSADDSSSSAINKHNNSNKTPSIEKTETNSHNGEQTSAKFSLNEDQDDRVSISSQINQLNQTLLKQIDDLTVFFFNLKLILEISLN